MKKIILIILSVIILIVVGAFSYLKFALPNVGPAPDIVVEVSEEQLLRGKYLANHVAGCTECHSQRDWSLFAGPMKPGTFGMGGELFDRSAGIPGEMYSPNITPAGIGDWTDGELYRAITSGVRKDGSPIFALMPYLNYGQVAKEDIYAIIAYIRTLESKEGSYPATKLDFPLSLIVNTMPAPANHNPIPDESDKLAYGEYMLTMAGCADCHSGFENGQFIEGMRLAGGREFPFPTGMVRTPNLTPHETGLAGWTEDQFIERFKIYQDSGYVIPKIPEGGMMTTMPWVTYSGMEEEDLSAIFAYLQSLDPINNAVTRWELFSEDSSD